MVIVVTIDSLKRKTGLFNLGYSTHGMHLTQCGCLRLGFFFFFFCTSEAGYVWLKISCGSSLSCASC